MSEKIEIDSNFLEYLQQRCEFKAKEDRKRDAFLEDFRKAFAPVLEEALLKELEARAEKECGEKGIFVIKLMRVLHKYGVPLDGTKDCIDELVELFLTLTKEGDDGEKQ